ncbi:hydroxymethylglutaryl-CoA lyase [Oceanicoccus sagamiensis]|uniref:Hydroxymethylglutaryl-CoA lyase n=1 Tax=Oceanicoccus sagamiensis TaxID=716816 RepID=A0A1X9NEH5_9GAMM|nr:hydroxymethylglutaryl-CoA lyase [Oceanicoccus sagamiensis]ARN73337.1 hydroxymethylglutaryl-CoA lyase [Oceanicoccus sagamiensis]
MTEKVFINDVGPRDGLQNQAKILTPAERLQLINALVDAKLPAVEIGSFVNPKAVPAMAGTDEIAASLPSADVAFSALVANQKGYELARDAGVKIVNLPIAASNTMNEKNIRKNNAEAIALTVDIIEAGKKDGIEAIPYIATAWECPFEGIVDDKVVIEMTGQFLEAGAKTIIMADTIGAANPGQVTSLYKQLIAEYGAESLGAHFHDTRGFGVADAYAALEAGIRIFDASIGGLGGCPFAPGATGNVATEDIVVLFEQMGFDTGVDLNKLIAATDLATELTGNCDGGHSMRWLKRQQEKGTL